MTVVWSNERGLQVIFVGLHLTVDGFLMASDGWVTSLFIAAQGTSTPSLGQLSRLPDAPPLLSTKTKIPQCVPVKQRTRIYREL